MLRCGGDLGDVSTIELKVVLCNCLAVVSPLKMKKPHERTHLSLAVVAAQLNFPLKPDLWFWAVTVGSFGLA